MFSARRFIALATTSVLFACVTEWSGAPCRAGQIAVGASKIEITPTAPVLLAGYGGRPGEYEGIDTPLWARAMAVGDEQPLLVIAVDNCGVPAAICDRVAHALAERIGTPRSRIVVCSTHTHNAPTLTGYAPIVWSGHSTAAQQGRVDEYTEWLAGKLVEVGVAASNARQPATLWWGQGRVGFGGNRRVLEQGKWVGFGFQRDAPVDHSLPVMVAKATDGAPLAVWVGYACHCTTVGSRNFVGGDWAGAANDALEREFAGAIAITTIGCGADIGPVPDAGLDAARQYGEQIAAAARAIDETGKLTALSGPINAHREVVALPLADPPPRATLQELAAAAVPYRSDWAGRMLEQLDRDGTLQTHVDLPLTTWTFGRDLGVVFLGGEVVVDYAHRLKHQLDWRRLWINAWADDVPCYIPSQRILAEGGYEADFSMIYYAKPAPFAPALEDLLIGRVAAALGQDFIAPPDAKAFPYGRGGRRITVPRCLRDRHLPTTPVRREGIRRRARDRRAARPRRRAPANSWCTGRSD